MAHQQPANPYAPPSEVSGGTENSAFARAWRRFTRSAVVVLLIVLPLSGTLVLLHGALETAQQNERNHEPKVSAAELRESTAELKEAMKRHAPHEEVEAIHQRQLKLVREWATSTAGNVARAGLATIICNVMVSVGLLLMLAVILRREGRRPEAMLSRERILRLFAASLVLGVLEFIGGLLCLVPGLVLGIADAFVPYILLLEGGGIWAALKRSFRLTRLGGARVICTGVALCVISIGWQVLDGRLRTTSSSAAMAVDMLISLVMLPFMMLVWLSFWEDARAQEAAVESEAAAAPVQAALS